METGAIGRVPVLRLRVLVDRQPRADGVFVAYWMTAARRLRWNFALDRAIGWACQLKRPLAIIEVLACGGRWDCDRHHCFVLQGMGDHVRQAADAPALYYPYVEPKPGDCRGLFRAICDLACVVVTDDYPIVSPTMASVDPRVPVRVEKVDSNGLLPLRAADQAFPTAYAFRRFLQQVLREHLLTAPRSDPFAKVELPRLTLMPAPIPRRWPAASERLLACEPSALAALPIDHGVPPVSTVGGPVAACARWKTFLSTQLASYPKLRNQPQADATSRLSPYLHFGHISAHELFHSLARKEGWSPAKLADKASGSRTGWWGMSQPAEAFLDQLVTWRELGFNFCEHRSDYADYQSLPDWAKATLARHQRDKRPYTYSIEEFASAMTHDRLWNAAQLQLITEGYIHNYLRMLWGKKILEWTPSPQEALHIMIELNNRYALDGQDPNSYSGIFWIAGRYDRPWGPERPIFGTVRYMSSQNTARKVRVREYMDRYLLDWQGPAEERMRGNQDNFR